MPFVTPILLHYAFTLVIFHWQRIHSKPGQAPPTFPHYLPIIGHTIRFLLDGPSLIRQATSYHGKQTAVAITLLTEKLFFFQGPKNVSAAWKAKDLASPSYVYSMGLKYFFGMKDHALKTYLEDDSGPFKSPHPSSQVKPHNRLDFLSHETVYQGLSGPGMSPAFVRLTSLYSQKLQKESVGKDWQQYDDLMAFYDIRLGSAMIEALYGPSILAQNPDFMNDLWEYNKFVPMLAKRVPRIFAPRAYTIRDRLVGSVRKWHDYARENFHEASIEADGDSDPYWGCQMMRERQRLLLGADRQDHDSVASTDLGLIWTTVVNIVPSSMLACLELFRDPLLLGKVRECVLPAIESIEPLQFNVKKLESIPILLSIYAETLRLHTQVYVARCSPHNDTYINGWRLPRNQISIVSSYPAHMDTCVWNTKDELHPLDTFWAERFLTYPDDPLSGPLSHRCQQASRTNNEVGDNGANTEPYFSMQGLEGSWIPYGGGHGICPGRNFAKRTIILTCAMMATCFDIEFANLPPRLVMDFSGSGLGVQRPKGQVPFKMRRRI